MRLPGPSKGWCLNPKGLLSGTPYHPSGTPWRVQVGLFLHKFQFQSLKFTFLNSVAGISSTSGPAAFEDMSIDVANPTCYNPKVAVSTQLPIHFCQLWPCLVSEHPLVCLELAEGCKGDGGSTISFPVRKPYT